MASLDLDEVTNQLAKTSVSEVGVSFLGKSLKLDTEEDAQEIVDAINKCPKLDFLNLEGNTLGVDASKAIAKALESHKEFKRALWKDLFTGRMKTEIPKALQFLGAGLVLAGARLTELDLSDNAFGPIGVEGLASLLRSPACHGLITLRLNNNGLGVTGGRLLAKALLDCHRAGSEAGLPLELQVFVAGRNRLENEGARALAEVFQTMGSLQEVSMPQNGIYHVGIAALATALATNTGLRVLNLNDNTVTARGAAALAVALPQLQQLREVNLGDCLLRTEGAKLLAAALAERHDELEELNLGFNEIRSRGALSIAAAMANKRHLRKVLLDGNQFGEDGRRTLTNALRESGHAETLGSLSEDEDEDEDEDSGDEPGEDEDEESDESEDEEEKEEDSPPAEPIPSKKSPAKSTPPKPVVLAPVKLAPVVLAPAKLSPVIVAPAKLLPVILAPSKLSPVIVTPAKQNGVHKTVAEFLGAPTAENFLALGDDRKRILVEETQGREGASELINRLETLMKVSALSASPAARAEALACSDDLYRALFEWVAGRTDCPAFTSELMIHLGLLKSEDKRRLPWDRTGCLQALEVALARDYFPADVRSSLEVFLGKQVVHVSDH